MTDALEKAIEGAVAAAAASIHATRISIHVGKRDGRKFDRQIEPMHFYAAFQALVAKADGVGKCETHDFAIFPHPVLPTTRLVYGSPQEYWQHTTMLARPFTFRPSTDGGWQFDASLTAEQRETVQVPNAVREARAIAAHVEQPLQKARTSLSMPETMHTTKRRWLRFSQFPAWIVWFAATDVTGITETNGLKGPERVYQQTATQTLEISLEYVNDGNSKDATELLNMLATCLGETEIAVERKFAADKQDYEMNMCL